MHWNLRNVILFLIFVFCVSEFGTTGRTFTASAVVENKRGIPSIQQAHVVLSSPPDPVNVTSDNRNNDTVSVETPPVTAFSKTRDFLTAHKSVIIRSLILLASVTGIVLLYLFVRCIRLRNRRSKSKKYGLITTLPDDNLEMRPLDAEDDEDEDMTVFERASQKTNRKSPRKK